MTEFVTWYNHAHPHSGIGLHTPADVHHGRHHQVRADREDTLTTARTAGSRTRRVRNRYAGWQAISSLAERRGAGGTRQRHRAAGPPTRSR